MACSTIVGYSQQEGFYRVPLPAARQTPNLEDQWLERSNSRHQVSPTSETTRAEGGTMGEKLPWILPKVATSTSLLGSFTCRKFTIYSVVAEAVGPTDGFTSPRKKGALRIFSPEKSDGFGRVWTRELGYQRPARSPLDHRSREKKIVKWQNLELQARR